MRDFLGVDFMEIIQSDIFHALLPLKCIKTSASYFPFWGVAKPMVSNVEVKKILRLLSRATGQKLLIWQKHFAHFVIRWEILMLEWMGWWGDWGMKNVGLWLSKQSSLQ